MRMMLVLLSALAALFTFGDTTSALAQTPTARPARPAPAPITPAQHAATTQSGKIASGHTPATAAPVAVGWNYVHASNCDSYWDGSTSWLYIYPVEGGVWWTNITGTQITIAPQCSLGNWIAFHVTNSSGAWDQVFTYNYR